MKPLKVAIYRLSRLLPIAWELERVYLAGSHSKAKKLALRKLTVFDDQHGYYDVAVITDRSGKRRQVEPV